MASSDIEFTYHEGDGEYVTLSTYCLDSDEAEDLVDEIQSVCGSNLERDASFVYVVVCGYQTDDAVRELQSHGVSVRESM